MEIKFFDGLKFTGHLNLDSATTPQYMAVGDRVLSVRVDKIRAAA